MRFTFDPAKNARNIAERGLSFERAADLEWDRALIVEDTRHDYGELRVISFRKASRKEDGLYEHDQATQP